MSEVVSAKPVRAYVVATDDPEDSVIVFATTNVAARRHGSDEIGVDFGSVTCNRLPWADEYAGADIPAKAYYDNGWFVSCSNCSNIVCEDFEREYGTPQSPVFSGPIAFCCQACKETHDALVAGQNAKFGAFERSVRELRPDLNYTSFRGAYPYISMTAGFMFDGAMYGGTVRDNGDGNIKWSIAEGDKSAWIAYESKFDEAPQ